jgi:hypothetical protein
MVPPVDVSLIRALLTFLLPTAITRNGSPGLGFLGEISKAVVVFISDLSSVSSSSVLVSFGSEISLALSVRAPQEVIANSVSINVVVCSNLYIQEFF